MMLKNSCQITWIHLFLRPELRKPRAAKIVITLFKNLRHNDHFFHMFCLLSLRQREFGVHKAAVSRHTHTHTCTCQLNTKRFMRCFSRPGQKRQLSQNQTRLGHYERRRWRRWRSDEMKDTDGGRIKIEV